MVPAISVSLGRLEDALRHSFQHRTGLVACASANLSPGPDISLTVHTMDGLSTAASVIAVVDMSAKITSLCFQYFTAVKDAKNDIERLQRKVAEIKSILEKVKQLLDGRDKARLSTTSELSDSLKECFKELEGLKAELEPGKARKTMSQFGVRALKWPFTSKRVEKIVSSLERYEQAFARALQVDQM